MDLPDRIAALAPERVLVAGSLPSPASDLDLLVRPGDAKPIERGLAEAGFEGRDGVWARFETREVVDLTDAGAWRLDSPETEALFAEAAPIEPRGRVCRPAPHHTLLILARRAMRDGAVLLDKRAERIELELELDPAAFARARERAAAWGAERSLAALERAFGDRRPIPASVRRRAIAEELEGSRDRRRAAVGAWRAVLRRPRRGRLVEVTGSEAAARVRQADELAAILGKIGFDVARLGDDATAAALYRRLLGGGVVVRDGAPDAGTPPGLTPAVAHRLDPGGDEERRRVEIARRTWAALAG